MPNFDSNDPREFGWPLPPTDVVRFVYRGHEFYSGLSRRVVPVFTSFLDELCALPGFQLHSGSGADDGDWGYEDRAIRGGTSKSFHAFALALDINAPWNPLGVGNPDASIYRVPAAADGIALRHGLLWGGNVRFQNRPDRMHVECHLSPTEIGRPIPVTPGSAFPLPVRRWFGPAASGEGAVTGVGANAAIHTTIARIQRLVGATPDGLYGPLTRWAVVRWQSLHRVAADGLVGPVTWKAMGL